MLANFKRSLQEYAILRIIMYIAIGIFFIVNPKKAVEIIVYILSAYMLISGVLHLYTSFVLKKKLGTYGFDLVTGIIQVLLAVIFFFFSKNILAFFPFIIGVLFIISGAMQLAINISSKIVYSIIYSIFLIVLGFIFLFNPFSTLLVFAKILGVVFIIMAISEIYIFVQVKKAL